MKQGWIRALVVLTAVILLLTGLMLTATQWLPRLAALWLPENTTLVLNGQLRWQQGRCGCQVYITALVTASW